MEKNEMGTGKISQLLIKFSILSNDWNVSQCYL